jgi:hypothetical protein
MNTPTTEKPKKLANFRACMYETYQQVTKEGAKYFIVWQVVHEDGVLKGYELLRLFKDQQFKFVEAETFDKLLTSGVIRKWDV